MKKMLIFFGVLALVAAVIFALISRNEPATPETPRVKRFADKPIVDIIEGLKTCEVCGYNALREKRDSCQNCGVALNNEALEKEGVSNMQELVMVKQIDYFMPDTLGTPIDFMAPVVTEKGYPKNPNWHPKIYESQIYEIQRALIEAKSRKDSVFTDESTSQRN